ncbi:helix-turn-helix transcriptional regulator [Tropicibacter sp. R15_0]|uniref:helix-turn-helix domain-containing protein n=1 Tax=Tropicibacter sp. R15_0 TaxID=2821101 RepID=UPI001ADA0662|nr:helix-turn-helix transcriptional regulator [Tropicibacter sp. R15_0]MBO9467038.1 helix-turn-helix transcriptional regulator [Tropicibacter sp. R15_0]
MTRSVNISTLSKRVNEQAERAGLSLTALAQAADLGKSTLTSLLQSPDRTPRPSTLNKVARALDVDPKYLLGETDEPGTWATSNGSKIKGLSEGIHEYTAAKQGGTVEYFLSNVRAGMGADVAASVLVDPDAPIETGTLYLAEFDDQTRRIVYLAEPYLFWVAEDGEPSHAIRGEGVAILGKLLNRS